MEDRPWCPFAGFPCSTHRGLEDPRGAVDGKAVASHDVFYRLCLLCLLGSLIVKLEEHLGAISHTQKTMWRWKHEG